jgi:mevalonate kinase
VTLDIGRKMRVGCLEKCSKVGKFTKIYMKLTKSGGIALAEVGEMCKTLEKLGAKKESGAGSKE